MPADTKTPHTSTSEKAEVYFRTLTGRPPIDLVMSHILDGLISGDLVPGQRINANRLSEQLDVSIVPVREAIHFLAGEGVIELLPLKGAQIRQMNARELVDWWHVYRVIAELGFRGAAVAIAKKPDLAPRITTAINHILEAEKNLPAVRYILCLTNFHRVINEIAEMPVLDEATRRLQAIFWGSFLPDYIPFNIYGPTFSYNYQIVGEAIIRGDGETAVSAFKHHVDWSSSIIEGERPVPGAPWHSHSSE